MLDHVAHATATASIPARPPTVASPSTPRVDSLRLLRGGRELVIDHAGQEYRLRLTRNNKLILTR
jgi:hemin uptake protein HemP